MLGENFKPVLLLEPLLLPLLEPELLELIGLEEVWVPKSMRCFKLYMGAALELAVA